MFCAFASFSERIFPRTDSQNVNHILIAPANYMCTLLERDMIGVKSTKVSIAYVIQHLLGVYITTSYLKCVSHVLFWI